MQNIFRILTDNYFLVIYAITWIVSVITYKRYFDTVLKYFPILIAYTFFNELLAIIIRDFDEFQIVFIERYRYYNVLLFNIYYFVFFGYFLWVYFKILEKANWKRNLKYALIAFIVFSIANTFIQDPMLEAQLLSFSIGSLFLIIAIVLYFIQLKQNVGNLFAKHNLLFWVSLSILIFHTLYLPIKLIRTTYEYFYLQIKPLHLGLIAVMYLLFVFGFIVSKRPAFR